MTAQNPNMDIQIASHQIGSADVKDSRPWKLSIVILCWNDLKVITDCLRSIYSGTHSTEFRSHRFGQRLLRWLDRVYSPPVSTGLLDRERRHSRVFEGQ